MLHTLIDLFLHLDKHLNDFAAGHPTGVYVVLAAIVFCETAFVITPFLPGDSLLFAVGALAAADNSPINLPLVMVLLCLAANCGDLVNYSIGRRVGPRIFRAEIPTRDPSLASAANPAALGYETPAVKPTLVERLMSRKHLMQAQAFYEKHGRMTIIMARFVPIVRTFAPFVAGIGRMEFGRFIGFSVGGGILWVVSLSLAGYFFGQIDFVKKHFELVVLAIVFISIVPMIVHTIQARRKARRLLPVIAEIPAR